MLDSKSVVGILFGNLILGWYISNPLNTQDTWKVLIPSSYVSLIEEVLDNTRDVYPVEIVVPIDRLGIETKVISPALVLLIVHHHRPQPLRVRVIEASQWSEQIK